MWDIKLFDAVQVIFTRVTRMKTHRDHANAPPRNQLEEIMRRRNQIKQAARRRYILGIAVVCTQRCQYSVMAKVAYLANCRSIYNKQWSTAKQHRVESKCSLGAKTELKLGKDTERTQLSFLTQE